MRRVPLAVVLQRKAATFWAQVRLADSGCWIWTGFRHLSGHAYTKWQGRVIGVHRMAYFLLVGPLKEGLVLDHLCSTNACVNPKHLEPVSRSENTRRMHSGHNWIAGPVEEPPSSVAAQREYLLERFWLFVEPEPMSGCWIWMGSRTNGGYGKLRLNGRSQFAHRVSYELHHSAIPPGYELDHLCRTPSCVNPSHLESVTPAVNVRRGLSIAARYAQRTHCLHGHLLSREVTRRQRRERVCRVCERGRHLAWLAKKKAS